MKNIKSIGDCTIKYTQEKQEYIGFIILLILFIILVFGLVYELSLYII